MAQKLTSANFTRCYEEIHCLQKLEYLLLELSQTLHLENFATARPSLQP